MSELKKQKVALVTGSAGFIGFHVCRKLIADGWRVVGIDCLSDYYDINLKKRRQSILLQSQSFSTVNKRIEEQDVLNEIFQIEQPDVVIHLAAQAGVRYSIENPRSYLESNLVGTFELLEAARTTNPQHMLIASTSSAYGANLDMPYNENHKADHQMSFYAATKKASENIAHSYSHIYGMPITMFRFFTVYGPWGRPDMALFKFTKAILEDEPIQVFNFGDMKRDFTYIDDLVKGIVLLIEANPSDELDLKSAHGVYDSLSPIAPFRIVNIGNSKSEKLTDFIEAIENAVGKKAKKNLLPIQAGDVPATWADTSLLTHLTNFTPETDIQTGVSRFVSWYREYYNV